LETKKEHPREARTSLPEALFRPGAQRHAVQPAIPDRRRMRYHSRVMRIVSCFLVISLGLLAQSPKSSKLFPIPQNMQERWPGAGLSAADNKLLRKAVEFDLRDLDQYCEDKSNFDRVDSAEIPLGKLGKGVIVRMSGSCVCGATGNCPIYVYAQEKGKFRAVLADHGEQPQGWAFAVVSSKAEVPDLVLASNLGGGIQVLILSRYSGEKFETKACETLTKKDGAEGKSWWDPSAVLVRPCGGD
jgi:hypothetical protein